MFPLSREELELVSAPLAQALAGARIDQVGVPDRPGQPGGILLGEVALTVAHRRERRSLLLRADAPAALALSPTKVAHASAAGAGWMQGLRKHLVGRRILEFRVVSGDRAVILELEDAALLWVGLFPVAPVMVLSVGGGVVVSSDPKRFPTKSPWEQPAPVARAGEVRPEFRTDPLATLWAAWQDLRPRSKKRAPSVAKKQPPPLGQRSVLTGGYELIIGRNAEENHEITFHVARGRDLWLHVEGASGAHGIVRLSEGQSLPLPALLEAAQRVADRSLPRGWPTADVMYTLRKHVRPAPGGHPGRVLVREAKTLRVKNPRSQSG